MTVLFLTHRLPYLLNRGDRMRAYYLLREMATFARVSLFSLVHDDEEEAAAGSMPFAHDVRVARVSPIPNHLRGILRLAGDRPLTHSLLDAAQARHAIADLAARCRPDVVLAFCSSMARFALQPPLDRRPFVLDMVDVDSEKWRLLAARSRWPLRWIYRREAETLGRFEALAAARAAATLVVNDREGALLGQRAPSATIHVMESGIDLDRYAPPGPPEARPTVVFTGVMNYAPNVQGMQWFARQVWPQVRVACPDARLRIVGASPTAAVTALGRRDPSIDVTGAVETIQPSLWQAALAIAPLHLARGLQNKVLEALAAGLPVVVTAAVFEGLPQSARAGCRRADDAASFAAAVIELLQRSPDERRREAARADLSDLSWDVRLRPLHEILRGACVES